jgi:hypothetical protein
MSADPKYRVSSTCIEMPESNELIIKLLNDNSFVADLKKSGRADTISGAFNYLIHKESKERKILLKPF